MYNIYVYEVSTLTQQPTITIYSTFWKQKKKTVKNTMLEVFFKSIHFCEKFLGRSTDNMKFCRRIRALILLLVSRLICFNYIKVKTIYKVAHKITTSD